MSITIALFTVYCIYNKKNIVFSTIAILIFIIMSCVIQNNGKYFIAQGGIACLLAKCIKSSQIVAFEELGTEAVRKLYVEKLPLKVVI